MRSKAKGKVEVEHRAKALQRLKVTYEDAASIKPNGYNPNRQSDHDFLLLAKSMDEDGFTQPIVVYERTREIVDGEHRWTCLIVLEHHVRAGIPITLESTRDARQRRLEILGGMPDLQIPVAFVDMTPEQMRVSTLRHNRARGSEDVELTAQVLRDLRELGALDWAAEGLQLDDVELHQLLEDIPVPEIHAGDEFGEAWEPISREQAVLEGAGGESRNSGSTSLSAEAIENQRRRERELAAAKTEQEREKARHDTAMYRIVCVFSGEEALIVKAVLGMERQAERILELCKVASAGAQ